MMMRMRREMESIPLIITILSEADIMTTEIEAIHHRLLIGGLVETVKKDEVRGVGLWKVVVSVIVLVRSEVEREMMRSAIPLIVLIQEVGGTMDTTRVRDQRRRR